VRLLLLVVAAMLAASGCGGSESRESPRRGADQLRACVRAWNQPANFVRGRPGAVVRRLEPSPAVPLYAHLSRDRRGRCVVFLDTPSTVDDRRFIGGGGFSLDCAGACGQQVPRGARTFQFRPDGSLPSP
jgi:uncharacterized protein YceK